MSTTRWTSLRGSGFFTHVGVFLAVNIALALFVSVREVDFPWWFWVTIAWAVVLVAWGTWLLWVGRHGAFDDDSRFDSVKMARRSPW